MPTSFVEVSDADRIYNELAQKKVIVRNRNRQVTNCVRITIGTPAENNELLNKLRTLV